MSKRESCSERVHEAWESRREDFELFMRFQGKTEEDIEENELSLFEEYNDDAFAEYGLEFVYVPAGTFKDQDKGYYSYLLSTGGPHEEIRFYSPHKIRFYLIDWGDSAYINIPPSDPIVEWILSQFDYNINWDEVYCDDVEYEMQSYLHLADEDDKELE